jgi:hypothetical protein
MLFPALLTCACSRGDTADDVPPLPDQTAETAYALMAEAERAAGNAAMRAETSAAPARSIANPVEEETP